ncbi:hypothetical protein BJV82DRAFT_664265 [Fennellomyces sp. T-0311]|nr:hypothetical protein BJV82DRAFT_664265 [Fennellomyces sp. T-0311]
MEGRPKRQSAVDKDYRERKRIRKEKEGDEEDVVQTQCRQLYRLIKDYRDPDDPEYFLSTLFAQLPSKRTYPDYYDVIKNPIALSNMKTKIDQQEYTSVADLKADIDLMVSNAKKYNIKESQVYQDAIKIHKYVKHWRPDDEKAEHKKSSSKDKPSSSPSDTKGKTVLKLPGGAFGNNAARNNPPHQVKAIRLKAVDKQSKKRTVTLKELMDAIAQNDTKKTLELLEADPTINVNELLEVEMFGDTFKWGPLHSACYHGDIKVCQALITMGANVELHDTWYSATPLSWAAFGDKDKVARLLVEKYNANRKAKNVHKQVPFDVVTDKDDPRWIGIFKGPYTSKQDKKSPEAKSDEHSQRSKESQSPATESPQPAKKRRGRPPKAEKESLDAQNRPVEEVDLQDFDPVAYMKDIFHQLRVHTDNAGRLYSEIFEDLPDRKEYPDYYNVITKPRSLRNIEDNMVNRRYPTLGAWFDDIKLVFENAKEYNEPGSRVHRDAKLLLRLLIRLKERNLSRFGVPESQEKDVMRMTLSNRSYDTDDRRRPKRATSSKPRAMTEDSTTTSTPESGVMANGGIANRSIISRPFMNAPNVVNILGAISTNSAQPTFPTPEFVAAASAEMMAATNDQLLLNGQRPPHLSEDGVQVPVASPAFFDLFNVDVRDLRPLKSIQLESSDKSFAMTLDGEVVGHSFTVPSKVDVMTIKPVLDQVLISEHKRVSVAVLQNNGRLNMTQGSLDATGDPPCWQSAPLIRGLNTIKITITANVTKASGSMPEYRTQIYFLFITQTW